MCHVTASWKVTMFFDFKVIDAHAWIVVNTFPR